MAHENPRHSDEYPVHGDTGRERLLYRSILEQTGDRVGEQFLRQLIRQLVQALVALFVNAVDPGRGGSFVQTPAQRIELLTKL